MKPGLVKAIIKDIKERGYIEHKGVYYPPSQAAAMFGSLKKRKTRIKHVKTGWIDDTRNINNKEQRDTFVMFIEKELGVKVWPEFFFSTERLYRIDYALPLNPLDSGLLKIAIEVNGGIWSKGDSGHSSGKGILRDYEKANLLQSLGWKLITITPDQMLTGYTIDLIKSVMQRG